MTEQEWLEATNPLAMRAKLKLKTDERRLRLFACACCRRVWPFLTDEAGRHAVEVAERYADGAATGKDLRAACKGAARATSGNLPRGLAAYRAEQTLEAAMNAAAAAGQTFYAAVSAAAVAKDPAKEQAAQCDLLRDIFGNPFRPAAFAARWRTATAVAVAAGIYADRAFDRLPILADALQDAGCEDADILGHCRSAGPHVRGCWVVDLVLGKA